MTRQLSAMGSRDATLIALLLAGLAGLFALAGALTLGAAAVTALAGGPWRMPPADTWAPSAIAALTNPRRPAGRWGGRGPKWSEVTR
jgi:hypothetical protein